MPGPGPRRQPPRPRRALLDDKIKISMFAVLVRNEDALRNARRYFTTAHAQQIAPGAGLVWKVVLAYYGRHRKLPTKNRILNALNVELNEDPKALADEDDVEWVNDFLDFAFDPVQQDEDIATSSELALDALAQCQQFLHDQIALKLRCEIVQDETVPADFPAVLEGVLVESRHSAALVKPKKSKLYARGWDTKPTLARVPLGVAILNTFTGGGLAAGEVLTLMAPYGTCKTLTAVELTAHLATHARMLVAQGESQDGRRPVAVLISTEMGQDEFEHRFLCAAAKISRARLKRVLQPGHGIETLSRARTRAATPETEYETRIFPSNDTYDSEYVRARMAIAVASRYVHFLDCSEFAEGQAVDSMEAIAAAIEAEFPDSGDSYPIAFSFDHASALALRIHTQNPRMELREILTSIPLVGRDALARRFAAPLVIFHQLSGEANSFAPGREIHHTHASECKSFSQYADFAVQVGRPLNDERQLAWAGCTKHRREPPRNYSVVQIDGEFGRLLDASAEFVCDPRRGIIAKSDYDVVDTRDYDDRYMPGLGG